MASKARTTPRSTSAASAASPLGKAGAAKPDALAGYAPAVQPMAHAPATHLVVFRQSKPSYAGLLATSMGLKPAFKTAPQRPGLRWMEATEGTPSPSLLRFYERFGVAAVSLTESQRRELLRHDEVAGVYVNTMRSVPRPVDVNAWASLGRPPVQAMETPAHAYLRGVADAALLALRLLDAPAPAAGRAKPRNAALSWCLEQIGLKAGTRWTGKGVKVAVLDTGIDREHPDLAGRVVAYRNFVEGSSDNDVQEHGTHCAGIVAGSAKPASGPRYGVAPQCELVIGKVLGDDGRGWDDAIIDGMDWAVDQGARVISMSLGAPRAVNQPYSAVYEDLARNFAETTPGVLIVAAAGNEAQRPQRLAPVGNPAACPSILAVAAVDAQKQVAWFSCATMDQIGTVDVAGPGVDVVSAKPGGSTQSLSGTSMATPHVAGLAALYLQQNPKLTSAQLWAKLVERCTPAGAASDVGQGIVQAP